MKLLKKAAGRLRTIQDLGGWRSLRMGERYSHLSLAHKIAAVDSISEVGREALAALPTALREA